MQTSPQDSQPDTQPDTDLEAGADAAAPKKRKRSLELVETVVAAFLLAILIRATVAEARFIPSGSMLPTLQIGDRLIVEKISYYFTDPARGDIMVFYPPNPAHPVLSTQERFLRWLGFTAEHAYIKRVVGLPGETLEVKNGVVLINHQPLTEDYIQAPPFDDFEPITIPADHYFMMGDNRNNSRDSRFWGTLPEAQIIGRTALRFWPLTRFGTP